MKKGIKTLAMWLIIVVIAIVILSSIMENSSSKMTYSELITSIENREVENVKISSNGNTATVKVKNSKVTKEVNIPSLDSFISYSEEYLKTGDFTLEEEKQSIWLTIISLMSPFGLLIIFLVFWLIMMNGNSQTGNKTMSFGKSKARLVNAGEKNRVTFDDVAGVDEEKEELQEIVEFLKNPKKFTDMGARIPKGVLLVGQPGTGKTLLAKAVAGEAGVPFYSISGSDFVEMFVGVGASRVRDLFEQAKKNSPSLIFIDEIDAVGRQRGAGLGGGHDEREQTLNQLLVEMDGFGANEGIIMIAATNRPDILDPALLRPGRFDRQIMVGRPDRKGREAVLEVHTKKKPLDTNVSLEVLAKRTPGFSGADLENLANEAALLAVRKNKKKIGMDEFEEAITRVIAGPEKKSRTISEHDRKLTAYHEAGHAVVMKCLKNSDPVHEISIIPRGMAGGYTMHLPTEDRTYTSKEKLLDEMVGLLGGRVAEKLILGDISTGAKNDIDRASSIARAMVMEYGMSDKIGTISYGSDNNEVFLGRDLGRGRNFSEEVGAMIDKEIKSLISNAYNTAEELLKKNVNKLHAVASTLLEKEKIDGKEFEEIFDAN